MRAASRAAPLAGLKNLGPKSAEWLTAAGIHDPATLRRLGAIVAFRRVQRVQPRASLNLLYALVGALEDVHWTEVRRKQRLSLALALESAPQGAARAARGTRDELGTLRNVGPATRRDLARLGIENPRQLARRTPDALFVALEKLAGPQDPCVWDVFAAAIHHARTGEALPWWHFSAERKRRVAAGTFARRASRPGERTRGARR